MKHPHAEIIKALADDDSLTLWQRLKTGGLWVPVEGVDKIMFVVSYWTTREFHLGPTPPPRMIETPYGSYPEPRQARPRHGARYWVSRSDGRGVFGGEWDGCADEMLWLKAGVLHLTLEAAEQQAQVELKRRMAELGWEKS